MRSFIAVMDSENLQAAANKLNISQPTISRHIATLEKQLGSVLFERVGRQLVPTNLAHGITEHARVMESGANAIGLALTAKNQSNIGSVRISSCQIFFCQLLPLVLKNIRKKEPGISLELVSSNHMSDLLRREADIAIHYAKPDDHFLISRFIGYISIGFYAHKHYFLETEIPQTVTALKNFDLIGFDHHGTDFLHAFQNPAVEIEHDQFCIRTDDHVALWQAVKAGMGVGLMATFLARHEPDLIHLLPNIVYTRVPVWATVHREIRSNPRIRFVYDNLVNALTNELSEAAIEPRKTLDALRP